MSSGPHVRTTIPLAATATEPPRQTPRLKLKPKAPTTGYVDGAWWPRSRNLSAELPALLAVLAVRLGHVRRVSYNLTAWDTAQRRVTVDGRQVRLGGFHSQHPHTVDVIGPNQPCITLLVISPETDPATAHLMLIRAARRGNADIIDELLTLTPTEPVPATSDLATAALEQWELDGGHDPMTTPQIPHQR